MLGTASKTYPSTGDIGLASCLLAVGIPPAPERRMRVVKNLDGTDFSRFAFGHVCIDNKLSTSTLMDRWRQGADGVRANRATAFAMLQVWNMTRAAMFALRSHRRMTKGLCGGHNIIVESRDVARWVDPGTAWEFAPIHDGGESVAARSAELSATLVLLGCELMGVDEKGRWVFSRKSAQSNPDAMECAQIWPRIGNDRNTDAAYMAAASSNRNTLMDLARSHDPTVMLKNEDEIGAFSQAKYEAGEKGACEIARRLGL